MTLESIKNLSNIGYSWHKIQEEVEQAKKPIPFKPKKLSLKDKHTATEADQYAKDLAIYEIELASYTEATKSVEEYNDKLYGMFEEFLSEESGLTEFNEEKQRLILDFRYNSLRSCESIVHKYEQIVEIIDFIQEISKL